jgi:hypothetical protein
MRERELTYWLDAEWHPRYWGLHFEMGVRFNPDRMWEYRFHVTLGPVGFHFHADISPRITEDSNA